MYCSLGNSHQDIRLIGSSNRKSSQPATWIFKVCLTDLLKLTASALLISIHRWSIKFCIFDFRAASFSCYVKPTASVIPRGITWAFSIQMGPSASSNIHPKVFKKLAHTQKYQISTWWDLFKMAFLSVTNCYQVPLLESPQKYRATMRILTQKYRIVYNVTPWAYIPRDRALQQQQPRL